MTVEPMRLTSSEKANSRRGQPDTGDPSQLRLLQGLREQALAFVQNLDGPVSRVSLAVGACTVEVEWTLPAASASPPAPAADPAPVSPAPVSGAMAPGDAPAQNDSVHRVTAPLVGTFYRRPQPGADPFVSVGDLVESGQTLAIVEAMKLMNPIIADFDARIAAIHPADGEIVEYGQLLFDLAPVSDQS